MRIEEAPSNNHDRLKRLGVSYFFPEGDAPCVVFLDCSMHSLSAEKKALYAEGVCLEYMCVSKYTICMLDYKCCFRRVKVEWGVYNWDDLSILSLSSRSIAATALSTSDCASSERGSPHIGQNSWNGGDTVWHSGHTLGSTDRLRASSIVSTP